MRGCRPRRLQAAEPLHQRRGPAIREKLPAAGGGGDRRAVQHGARPRAAKKELAARRREHRAHGRHAVGDQRHADRQSSGGEIGAVPSIGSTIRSAIFQPRGVVGLSSDSQP